MGIASYTEILNSFIVKYSLKRGIFKINASKEDLYKDSPRIKTFMDKLSDIFLILLVYFIATSIVMYVMVCNDYLNRFLGVTIVQLLMLSFKLCILFTFLYILHKSVKILIVKFIDSYHITKFNIYHLFNPMTALIILLWLGTKILNCILVFNLKEEEYKK